ncbi:hypothetical protein ACHAWF_016019 [Thalassiosira exigua]
MKAVIFPVQVMRCLRVKLALVTNAMGGLKEDYVVRDTATIRDYIALPLLAGKNPPVGPNDELGPRFPSTSNLFDAKLQDVTADVAKQLDFDKYLYLDGTYAFVSGRSVPCRDSLERTPWACLPRQTDTGCASQWHGCAMREPDHQLLVVYFDEPDGHAARANHEVTVQAVRGEGSRW